MSINNWKSQINDHLHDSLEMCLPNHEFKKAISYSVFPTGKVFRPLLVYTTAHDLNLMTEDHKFLASSIELHHTYTLIHDDLPAMDNDDFRRDRLANHKKFNEWTAILAGDSLLNISYELLGHINPSKIGEILKLYSVMTGPKGLILGQVMDLGQENNSFANTLRLHELKTARLIQLSLMGSAILSNRHDLVPVYEEIGLALGINFQLIDDLCELTDPITKHEKEINPFFNFDQKIILDCIAKNNQRLKYNLEKHKLKHLTDYIEIYLNKMKEKVLTGINEVKEHVDIDLNDLDKIL